MSEVKDDKKGLGELRKVKKGASHFCSNCDCTRLTPCKCMKKGTKQLVATNE